MRGLPRTTIMTDCERVSPMCFLRNSAQLESVDGEANACSMPTAERPEEGRGGEAAVFHA